MDACGYVKNKVKKKKKTVRWRYTEEKPFSNTIEKRTDHIAGRVLGWKVRAECPAAIAQYNALGQVLKVWPVDHLTPISEYTL